MTLNLHPPIVLMEPVGSLEPYPGNPNEGDVGAITTMIAQNGWYGHVVAQRSRRRILAGHHRLQAAAQLGATHVPVEWLDVDDATARRIMLADNRATRLGRDDDSRLEELLREVRREDNLLGTGYDEDDYDRLLHDLGTPLKPELDDDREPMQHECPECGHQWTT